MLRSQEPSSAVDPPPEDDLIPLAPFARRLALPLRDLPTLSRWVGHITLALVVLLVTRNLVPRALELPDLDPFPSRQPDTTQPVADAQPDNLNGSRYLQLAAVPFTVRAMRDILPMSVPRRTARTSVMTYRVQPGDTLLGIAQKFGLEGNSLVWANEKLGDNPDFLRIGQELYILPLDGAYHTVAQGGTLERIAATYKIEPSAISGFGGNDLEPPYTLTAGQKLIIPGGIKPYVPRKVYAYRGTVPKDAKKGTGQLVWPMSGYITQRFWEGHRAIDIGAAKGTAVVASDSGYVAVAQWSDAGYGRMLIIDHGNGYQTLYAHLDVYYVEPGQSVGKGQKIGLCGTTGRSTGPHLHFETITNGVRRNPFIYLP